MALLGQFRRDTLANWQVNNPVLADGEFALVASNASHVNKYDYWVCGDGETPFNSLVMGKLADSTGITGITQEEGDSESLAVSQAFVSKGLTHFIDISDIDNVPGETREEKMQAIIKENSLRYIVTYQRKIVGIIEMCSDSMGHCINQVFKTNYLLDENGLLDINTHNHRLHEYIRYYNLNWSSAILPDGTSWPVGTWSKFYCPLETLEKIVDRDIIKDEDENQVDTPFHVITSPKFLYLISDSEDKILAAFRGVDGKLLLPIPTNQDDFLKNQLDAYKKVGYKFRGIFLNKGGNTYHDGNKNVYIIINNTVNLEKIFIEGGYINGVLQRIYLNDCEVAILKEEQDNSLLKETLDIPTLLQLEKIGSIVDGGVAYRFSNRRINCGNAQAVYGSHFVYDGGNAFSRTM